MLEAHLITKLLLCIWKAAIMSFFLGFISSFLFPCFQFVSSPDEG